MFLIFHPFPSHFTLIYEFLPNPSITTSPRLFDNNTVHKFIKIEFFSQLQLHLNSYLKTQTPQRTMIQMKRILKLLTDWLQTTQPSRV